MPHAITSTTQVRMAVARLELTPSMPTLARIEVRAANTAERIARIIHITETSCFVFYCFALQDRVCACRQYTAVAFSMASG